MYAYIAIYNGKRLELHAPSMFEAQRIAAEHFKQTKKPWLIALARASEN